MLHCNPRFLLFLRPWLQQQSAPLGKGRDKPTSHRYVKGIHLTGLKQCCLRAVCIGVVSQCGRFSVWMYWSLDKGLFESNKKNHGKHSVWYHYSTHLCNYPRMFDIYSSLGKVGNHDSDDNQIVTEVAYTSWPEIDVSSLVPRGLALAPHARSRSIVTQK